MGNSADHETVSQDNFIINDSLVISRQIRFQRNWPITTKSLIQDLEIENDIAKH
jgi:hypothetical protein